MIQFSKETKEALNTFDIKYPFTKTALIGRYRKLVHKYHPDKNNNDPHCVELCKNINLAYKILETIVVEEINQEDDVNVLRKNLEQKWRQEEDDITNLYDICPECKGLRTVKDIITVKENCYNCHGTGKVKLKCKYCDGGVYFSKSGWKVSCKACKGTGIWKEVNCNKCNPSFRLRGRTFLFYDLFFGARYIEKEIDKVCPKCNGRSKIKLNLFNPVIKKGCILKG